MVATPRHPWAGQQAVEKSRVETFKDCVQIVSASLGGMEALAAAHLPHQVRFPGDIVARNIASIADCGLALHWLAIHLRQQNVGDGLQHRCRGAFQQIGKAYKQFALAHPDSVLDAGELEEINLQLRDRIAGTKFPVALLEDVKKAVSHVEARLARAKS